MFLLRALPVVLGWALMAPPAAGQWQRHTIDGASRGADGVRLHDVNGDGFQDVTTGWEEGGAIRVCLHPGPAKVRGAWPAVEVGRVNSPEDAVFVDLDGDGAVDVVSSCEGRTRTVFVHWAPAEADRYLEAGAWRTEAIPCTLRKQSWMYAVPMQVDGRHGVDLVVGSKGGGASVGWLEAPPDPRSVSDWKYHRLCDAGWIMSIEAHDVDHDGDRDLVVTDRKGAGRGAKWLENPGPAAVSSGARWPEHPIGSAGKEVMFLEIADLDGDRREDVLVTNRNGHVEWFRRLAGDSVKWEAHRFPLAFGLPYGKSIAVGDLDGNGRPEVVTTNRGKEPVRCVAWQSFAESPAEARWSDHDIGGTAGAKFDLVELIDLDRDGDLDVMTCEEVANLGVVWYENPGLPDTR